MRAIIETLFDAVYLISAAATGILLIRQGGRERQFQLFGWMAVGAGGAFHLVPRALFSAPPAWKAIPSPWSWENGSPRSPWRFLCAALPCVAAAHQIKSRRALAGLRITLCMMSQNQWSSGEPSLFRGVCRNIPSALPGLLIILLFFRSARACGGRAFGRMWLAITLSFGFYIPVVLRADAVPMTGALMISKTRACAWTVLIGYSATKKECM